MSKRLRIALIAAQALVAATEWCVDGTVHEKGILTHARAAKRRVEQAIAEAKAGR